MSRRPEQPDELNDMLHRLEREFQQPQAPPTLSGANEPRPLTGSVTPLPPQRQQSIALPTARPRLVYLLLAINVVMYGVTLVVQRLVEQGARLPGTDLFAGAGVRASSFTVALYVLGAKWGPAIAAGQYWRLLLPMVLHGGLLHLAFNSYALFALGPQVERIYGPRRFLVLYLLAGLAGNVLSFVLSPRSLAIGASGAIFGLIGALAAWSYGARSLIGAEASRQQLRQLVTMAAINLVIGFSVANIDNSAHVGGLIVGGLVGLALVPRYVLDQQLYPPSLVPVGNAGRGWLLTGVIFAAILALAAYGIMRLGSGTI